MATVRNKADSSAPVDQSYDNNTFPIVPSDTLSQRVPMDAIYCGGAGDITIVSAQGLQVVYKAVPVGMQLVVGGISRVMATGTTATNLVGTASKNLK